MKSELRDPKVIKCFYYVALLHPAWEAFLMQQYLCRWLQFTADFLVAVDGFEDSGQLLSLHLLIRKVREYFYDTF